MKKRWNIILLGLLVFVQVGFAQDMSKVVCVAFYNFENLYDTVNQEDVKDEEFTPTGLKKYTSKVYLDKLSHLDEVVSQIGIEQTPDGAAIIGVAEIENRGVLEDFSKQPRVSSRHYQVCHFDSYDERGVDVGLLYNPKYFKVIKSRPLYVKLPEENGKKSYTRDILWVTGLLDGEKIHVFVNHWPSRRGGEEASAPRRAMAAGVCRKVVDSIQKIDPLAKVIVMGDLNDDPTSPSLTKHLKAVGKINNIKDEEFFNPWLAYYNKGIGTLAYNDSWNLFDQIVISKPFLDKNQTGWHFQKAEIFSRAFMTQKTGTYKGYPLRTFSGDEYIGGYSDHFPTYIYLLKPITK